MASKKAKSSVLASSKVAKEISKALNAHKSDAPTEEGGGDLPAGINGAIARLKTCEFRQVAKGKKNEGAPMFYADAIVVSPPQHNGLYIKGARTFKAIVLIPSQNKMGKDVAGKLVQVMDIMKKLGAPVDELDDDDLEGLEQMALDLSEASPYFRFDTWIGEKTKAFPNPSVQHRWHSIVEDFEEEVDDEVEEEEFNDEDEQEEEEEEQEADLPDDPATLAKLADNGDDDAEEKLKELATEAGIPKKTVDKAKNWKAVAKLIEEAESEDEEEEQEEEPEEDEDAEDAEDEEEESEDSDEDDEEESDEDEEEAEEESEEEDDGVPAVGKGYYYRPVNPRTNRKAKKPIEVTVSAVFPRLEKVNLKEVENPKKVHKQVPFADLEDLPF